MSPGRAITRATAAFVALIAGGLLVTPSAAAHGLIGRADLPIPIWLFAWTAAAVLIASFFSLAVFWSSTRLERPGARRVIRVPPSLGPISGALGVGVFTAVVYSGFAGVQVPQDNLAPSAVYVAFWVGIPVLSVLLGDIFRALSPGGLPPSESVGPGVDSGVQRFRGSRTPAGSGAGPPPSAWSSSRGSSWSTPTARTPRELRLSRSPTPGFRSSGWPASGLTPGPNAETRSPFSSRWWPVSRPSPRATATSCCVDRWKEPPRCAWSLARRWS